MNAVALIIDMQKDFFKHKSLMEQRGSLVDSVNDLVRVARAEKCPIVWVRTEFMVDMSDAFLDMRRQGVPICVVGSDGAKLLDELEIEPGDTIIVKKRYSAFFRTELDRLLVNWNPTHLIFAGIHTHACVRTTVIDAYQRDYDVILARDCMASYDQEHHAVSLRYMDGKIGTGMSNEAIKSLLRGETK